MSEVWIDCPTDGMTVSPPFCIRGGYITGHDQFTLHLEIRGPGGDTQILEQTVVVAAAPAVPALSKIADPPEFCFRVTAASNCTVTLVIGLRPSAKVEEASATVGNVTITTSGGDDCACPKDCGGALPKPSPPKPKA
jgi:hypothetical protein